MSEGKKGKILSAGKGLFLRYGYKRVSMNDIAEAAGISRPALYLVFKNKEEIFKGAYKQWVDEKILEIEEKAETLNTAEEKLRLAFELGVIQLIEAMKTSPELKELVERNFGYGSRKFENLVERFLTPIAPRKLKESSWTAERAAHLLVSAVPGFKQTAETSEDLRLLIDDCISLVLSSWPRD
jgi:TetR/AcrR family transcriptional regulator of autoinduction and epiphytic fitness